jgi:hypothetical protein
MVGPAVAFLGEICGGNDQYGTVGVMEHRMRDAAEHQRLNATEAARPEKDYVGVHIVGGGQNRSGDVPVPSREPRLRD